MVGKIYNENNLGIQVNTEKDELIHTGKTFAIYKHISRKNLSVHYILQDDEFSFIAENEVQGIMNPSTIKYATSGEYTSVFVEGKEDREVIEPGRYFTLDGIQRVIKEETGKDWSSSTIRSLVKNHCLGKKIGGVRLLNEQEYENLKSRVGVRFK
jgi:hypothetical protein